MDMPLHEQQRRSAPGRTSWSAVLLILLSVVLLAAAPVVEGGGPADWRQRIIYQLIIDRFDPTTQTTEPCANLQQWCGGTLSGANRRLEYVRDLGADALWINPVVKQCPGLGSGASAYHGYWAQDFDAIEPHIGTAEDMRALVDKAHDKGLLIMLDVVANHVGPCDISTINPFNNTDHYHDCTGCNSFCDIPSSAFESGDLPQLEHCRLSGLMDLNQSNPFVRQQLLGWARSLTQRYGVDGLRVDTAAMVARPFWREFADAAGLFTLGEVWFTGLDRVELLSSFAGSGGLDSVMSYPLYGVLRGVFGEQQDMNKLLELRKAYQLAFKPEQLGLLGMFIDNHDNARFLSYQPDVQLYKNVLTWVLLGEGIPIIYYGTEQGFVGGGGSPQAGDAAYREPLWTSGFVTTHLLYQHIKLLAGHRKSERLWEHPQVDVHAAKDCYAFVRGATVAVTTNVGAGKGTKCVVRLPEGVPMPAGGRLKNLFEPQAPDVQMDLESRTLSLDIINGSPLVLQMLQPTTSDAGNTAAAANLITSTPKPVLPLPLPVS